MFGHRYFGARYFGPRYFGPDVQGAAPQEEDFGFGTGSVLKGRRKLARDSAQRDERWRQRRKQIERIGRLLDGITDEIPADAPEAEVAREAEAAVEAATEKLGLFDQAALAEAILRAQATLAQAQAAMAHYEARRRRELEEQEEEDFLLMMS